MQLYKYYFVPFFFHSLFRYMNVGDYAELKMYGTVIPFNSLASFTIFFTKNYVPSLVI